MQHVPSLDGGLSLFVYISSTVFLTLHMYCLFTFFYGSIVCLLLVPHMTRGNEQESKLMQNPYDEAPPTIKFILIL
jgi:hypothetical protein